MPTLAPILVHRADYDRKQDGGEELRPGVPLLELLPYATDLPIYIETARADDVFFSGPIDTPYLRIQGYALPGADLKIGDYLTEVRDLSGEPILVSSRIEITAVVARAGTYLKIEGNRSARR